MNGLFYDKKVIQAAVETTYNTPPVFVAADAMMASTVNITPLVLDEKSRSYVRPTGGFGGFEKIVAGQHVQLSFEVPLAGSGAAGTAPAWGRLLRGCGYSETVNATVSVVYKPISSLFDSLSLGFNMDGQYHLLTGARGTFEATLKNGTVPMLKFTFTGIWNAPSALAMPTPDFTAWQTPLPINNVNTPTISLHGVAALLLESLDIKGGEKPTYRNLPNYEAVDMLGRSVTGSISFQAPDIATKDWFSAAQGAVKGALDLVHGTVAGNIIDISEPTVQLDAPKYSNAGGIAFIQAGLISIPSDTPGDDELVITAK